MFRSILGFAVLAILAWLGLKLIFGILGSLVGLAMTVLWLAFIGFVVYLGAAAIVLMNVATLVLAMTTPSAKSRSAAPPSSM